MEKKDQQLAALISMIDEPNEEVFSTIRQKIADYGTLAIPVLEDAWMDTFSDDYNERLEALIEDIRFDDLYQRLKGWKKMGAQDLLQAFIIVTKFRYPDLNEPKYLSQIDSLKKDVWLEMNDELTALEKTKVLNHILYDVHKFKGLRPKEKVNLNSFFLNELLDTKKGNAITLGILYILIAQQQQIPIFGIDLPGHFVLAYAEDMFPMQAEEKYTKEEVLFYINAMNKGAVFTANEVEIFIKQLKIESKPSFYLPCNNLTIIQRLIKELSMAYKNEGDTDKVLELEKLLDALD